MAETNPEPEDAGVASIRARLRAALRTHDQHPDWPCEDWGCADVDFLLRRLDAAAKRAERLAEALEIYADPSNWDYCENECEWTFDGPAKEVWTGPRGPNSYARAALAGDAPGRGEG